MNSIGPDGAMITEGLEGSLLITYRAIPYPLPEDAKKQPIEAGRMTGNSPPGDIAAIVRLEEYLRSVMGVWITRKFIAPLPR